EERDPALRAEIVAIADQMRTPAALDLCARALADTEPAVWKAGLDALVALHTPEAIALLERTHAGAPEPRTPEDYAVWVAEALQQARAAAEPPRGPEEDPT